MREVKLLKKDLVKRVKKNRDAHRGLYEKAMKGYQQEAAEFFEEQFEKAKNNKVFVTYFTSPMPEDHTADYDAVLDMLDMEISDTIVLTTSEFRQYVRDEWGWKQAFTTTSMNYLNKGN